MGLVSVGIGVRFDGVMLSTIDASPPCIRLQILGHVQMHLTLRRELTLPTLFPDTVLRRYSQGVLKEQYNVNEVLIMSEFIKVAFSVYMVSNKTRPDSRLSIHLADLIFKSRKMLILAVIYGVGNILSYYALARVGAGTFVVFAQGKTLTTAFFSVIMLGRQYSWTKIRALLTLVAGVILFVMPTLMKSDDDSGARTSEVIKGCLAQGFTIILSGFASIYFEKAIKNDTSSEGLDIWARNFQLGLHSIVIYVILLVGNPTSTTGTSGAILVNWTPLASALSVLGACGGLLVALSIKYGDSVLKTLAISGSIVYAAIVDRFLLGGPLTAQMAISASIVVLAIISYTFDATPTGDPATQTIPVGPMAESSHGGKKDEEEGLLELPEVDQPVVEGNERRRLAPRSLGMSD